MKREDFDRRWDCTSGCPGTIYVEATGATVAYIYDRDARDWLVEEHNRAVDAAQPAPRPAAGKEERTPTDINALRWMNAARAVYAIHPTSEAEVDREFVATCHSTRLAESIVDDHNRLLLVHSLIPETPDEHSKDSTDDKPTDWVAMVVDKVATVAQYHELATMEMHWNERSEAVEKRLQASIDRGIMGCAAQGTENAKDVAGLRQRMRAIEDRMDAIVCTTLEEQRKAVAAIAEGSVMIRAQLGGHRD